MNHIPINKPDKALAVGVLIVIVVAFVMRSHYKEAAHAPKVISYDEWSEADAP